MDVLDAAAKALCHMCWMRFLVSGSALLHRRRRAMSRRSTLVQGEEARVVSWHPVGNHRAFTALHQLDQLLRGPVAPVLDSSMLLFASLAICNSRRSNRATVFEGGEPLGLGTPSLLWSLHVSSLLLKKMPNAPIRHRFCWAIDLLIRRSATPISGSSPLLSPFPSSRHIMHKDIGLRYKRAANVAASKRFHLYLLIRANTPLTIIVM